jgi:hypothetical protein
LRARVDTKPRSRHLVPSISGRRRRARLGSLPLQSLEVSVQPRNRDRTGPYVWLPACLVRANDCREQRGQRTPASRRPSPPAR